MPSFFRNAANAVSMRAFSSSQANRNAQRINAGSQILGSIIEAVPNPGAAIPTLVAQTLVSAYSIFREDTHVGEKIHHGLQAGISGAELGLVIALMFRGEICTNSTTSICTAILALRYLYSGLLLVTWGSSEFSKDPYTDATVPAIAAVVVGGAPPAVPPAVVAGAVPPIVPAAPGIVANAVPPVVPAAPGIVANAVPPVVPAILVNPPARRAVVSSGEEGVRGRGKRDEQREMVVERAVAATGIVDPHDNNIPQSTRASNSLFRQSPASNGASLAAFGATGQAEGDTIIEMDSLRN